MATEKRIEQIVNHLVGTNLPLMSVLTVRERDDVTTMRQIYAQIFVHPLTKKWMRLYVTPKL